MSGNILIPLVPEETWLCLEQTFHPVSHYIKFFPMKKEPSPPLAKCKAAANQHGQEFFKPHECITGGFMASCCCNHLPGSSHTISSGFLSAAVDTIPTEAHRLFSSNLKEPFQNFFSEKAAGREFLLIPYHEKSI